MTERINNFFQQSLKILCVYFLASLFHSCSLMNPDLPDPIFLPPLHFSNERAYDRRKSSLISLPGDFPIVTAKRKLSLPWTREENEVTALPKHGIHLSAKTLSSLPSSKRDRPTSTNSTIKCDCSLPGQTVEAGDEAETSIDETNNSKSASAPVRSSERASSSTKKSVSANKRKKWSEIVANLTEENRRTNLSQNEQNQIENPPVTEQPRLNASNKLLPMSDTFPLNLVSKLPNFLASDSVTPKDINVNVRNNIQNENSTNVSASDRRGSVDQLLPSEITCPHCGERFQPPETKNSTSGGCSGTLSNACTYVAMAGVVLIGTGICMCLPFCVKTCKDIHTVCPWWPDLLKELVQKYYGRTLPENSHGPECYNANSLSGNFNPLDSFPYA